MNVIFKRRSIRKYQDKPVEEGKIEKILRAAMEAPSAGNQQPWEFLVIKDKKKLKELSAFSPYAKMVEDAALAIVLLADEDKMKHPENWQQDMSAATQNVLLEAVDEDLGGVWLGVAPVDSRMDYIKDMFDLPDNIKPFAVVPIGYPKGEGNKFVDRYDEDRVHYGKY
ncbi:MAG: nitroreductase family protein [Fusobacteriota bacterium]